MTESSSSRLDVALVERALSRSRAAARAAIEQGRVRVDGRSVIKPSHPVADSSAVTIDGDDRWVSRAAAKLIAALDATGIDVAGELALDLGASTGGFTQVLLERGARQVIALDVGHGQLAPELALDSRVIVIEGENARSLTAERLAAISGTEERPGIVVGDLSFISLTLIVPAIAATVGTEVPVVLLVKPQFEVGRQGIREGIVRDAAAREDAITSVLWAAADQGMLASDVLPSPLLGTNGNHEYLVVFRPGVGVHPTEWRGRVAEVSRAHPGTTIRSSIADSSPEGSS